MVSPYRNDADASFSRSRHCRDPPLDGTRRLVYLLGLSTLPATRNKREVIWAKKYSLYYRRSLKLFVCAKYIWSTGSHCLWLSGGNNCWTRYWGLSIAPSTSLLTLEFLFSLGNLSLYRSYETLSCLWDLAILFAVFALGSLLDLNKSPYNIEAQEYYYVARAAINLTPTGEVSSLKGVQTMIHIAQYRELSDWEANASNFGGMLVSAACKSAYAVSISCYFSLHEIDLSFLAWPP